MKLCDEMIKFREGLDKRKIRWKDDSTICPDEYIHLMMSKGFSRIVSDITMYRTHFTYKDKHYSVVYGYGSYGGVRPFEDPVDQGLLEMMVEDKITGWLTADDIFKILDKE